MTQVDKQSGVCLYNDKLHTYWVNGNENDKFVSVTTLIGQFHEKFDGAFWGRYKAFEAIADKEAFNMEKKVLLATKKWNDDILDRYGIDKLEFNTKVNEILDGYETKKNVACERGTKFHLEQEQKFYTKEIHKLPQYGLKGDFKCIPNHYDLNVDKGIFPEYLIYKISKDGVLKLAGQIDLLIKDGNDIYILDYKSNEKIDQKSYFNQNTKSSQMMFYPINNLPDCNYYHYVLQLSTYAWMVEQLNPNYIIKGLVLIHCDHQDKVTTYNLDYHKDDVIRMLGYHKKQKMIEQEKRKNSPIIF
jgi:CRISPR/Cas system-associated endoribonuclease Cas2